MGLEDDTPGARAEVGARLTAVGLRTDPPLSDVDGDAVVDVLLADTGVPTAETAPPAPVEEATPERADEQLDRSPEQPFAEQAAAQLREQQDQHDAEISALRDEMQTRLAAARSEAAAEAEARERAEALAADASEQLATKTAELADAERRVDTAFEERLNGILEVQESARKEREEAARELREVRAERDRLEMEATKDAARQDAKRAEAQRTADDALALLEAVRAEGEQERERRAAIERRLNALIAGGKPESLDRLEPESKVGERPPEPAARPARAPRPDPQPGEEPRHATGDLTDERAPAFHEPPPMAKPSRSLPRIGRGRRRRKGGGARHTCAVTGVQAPTNSEWELRRQGWVVSGQNALSPEAQADGWQFPDGAAMPFRKLSER